MYYAYCCLKCNDIFSIATSLVLFILNKCHRTQQQLQTRNLGTFDLYQIKQTIILRRVELVYHVIMTKTTNCYLIFDLLISITFMYIYDENYLCIYLILTYILNSNYEVGVSLCTLLKNNAMIANIFFSTTYNTYLCCCSYVCAFHTAGLVSLRKTFPYLRRLFYQASIFYFFSSIK